jgi:serine/threonine protein kinase
MATIHNDGTKVREFTIARMMNNGAMAVSYEARQGGSTRVFFKQYKSPSIRTEWYVPYISYQKEMRRRIGSPPCSRFCYRFLDTFEEKRCFYQVFEFLDHGHSLQKVLDVCAERPAAVSWPQRLILAKVLMAGIASLHEAKIVHSDLKPDNIMLIEDREIDAKYRLKIIDMDFSILTDIAPPWVGHEGFFGTPGYTSPEHHRGEVPVQASDVFTCGLMLYELLANGHPYQFEDADRIRDDMLAGRAPRPEFLSDRFEAANADAVGETIHRCLSPDPVERPTASEVNQALNGFVKRRPEPPPPPEKWSEPGRPPVKPEPAPPDPVMSLILQSASGREIKLNVRTELGRAIAAQLDREDSVHWEPSQLLLERDESGWWISPGPATKNETMLNGKCVTARTRLNPGDVIGVGRQSKGIVKLPLTVIFSDRPASTG